MEMDPLGAIRLREERSNNAFAAFRQGLDDLGNLDTYLKDRNLTVGDERPGVFGGSWWETWKTPKPADGTASAEGATPAVKGFAAFLPPKQPELADIHRFAKIRGLNHDQATIDEKTSRPERQWQHELEEKKVQNDEALRQLGYLQKDIDNARAYYDDALTNERTEQGRINSIREKMQAFTNLGLSIPEDLNRELALAQERTTNYATLRKAAHDYLSGKKGQGNIPSKFLGIGDQQDKPPAEEGQQVEAPAVTTVSQGKTARDFSPEIKKFAKGHLNENVTDFDVFLDSLGIDETQRQKARDMYSKEVVFNQREAERKHREYMQELERRKAAGELKQKEAEMQGEIALNKNIQIGINNFLQNPSYINFKLIEKKLDQFEAEGGDLSKVPYLGPLLEFIRSTNEANFNSNKTLYINHAKDKLNVINAKLKVLSPPKNLPKGDI
ncbi:MAG: hypothetical protein FWF63_00485 [Fibromonadales bacterium]|nr:hypothetical protein [Fibromonadales bacterium]